MIAGPRVVLGISLRNLAPLLPGSRSLVTIATTAQGACPRRGQGESFFCFPFRAMPPAPSTNDKYLLKALSGRVNPPNNAFYASLTGQANMLATAVHVLVALLGHCLKKQTASPDFLISLRLCIYIFVPYMLFDETADALTLPFFPLPLTIATFLQRLVKAGMPTERVSDKRAARELVGYWALKLPRDRRTFDASDFVQITTQPDNFLMHVTPPMARTTSESNAEVATFLCLLQGGFTNAEANTATFTGFCVMLIPMGLPAGCPPQLTAVRSCSHVRSTSADPPHDMFTEYTDILSEITRRHEPTKEDRFKPLFDARFAEVYTTAAAAFPQTVHPAAMRDRLTALGVALGLTLDFTHVGVSALCSVLQPQLQSLEVDAPAASTPDDGRFSAILRLHRDQPGGRIAPTTNGSAADGWKPEAGENIKLLLEDTSYMSLYQEVLSLNTSNTSMASVVAVVARHAHAAGLIIMTTPNACYASQRGNTSLASGKRTHGSKLSIPRLPLTRRGTKKLFAVVCCQLGQTRMQLPTPPSCCSTCV